MLGETRELRKVFFENITVKPATNDSWFGEKVNAIIALKVNKMDTIFLEKEIDEKIFDLYELTGAERALIIGNADTATLSEDSISAIALSESE